MKDEKKRQIVTLGRLGWSTRRIERETGVRRETVSAYLKEAGVAIRAPRGRLLAKPASHSDVGTLDRCGAIASTIARSDEPAKPASRKHTSRSSVTALIVRSLPCTDEELAKWIEDYLVPTLVDTYLNEQQIQAVHDDKEAGDDSWE
jgi:hypothetical protein